MNVAEVYNLAIKIGAASDFRPKKAIDALLLRRKEKYEKLSGEEKEGFDTESFTNPYSDTRILHCVYDRPVKKVLAGIDIGV
mgnify:CR=1 FL=1